MKTKAKKMRRNVREFRVIAILLVLLLIAFITYKVLKSSIESEIHYRYEKTSISQINIPKAEKLSAKNIVRLQEEYQQDYIQSNLELVPDDDTLEYDSEILDEDVEYSNSEVSTIENISYDTNSYELELLSRLVTAEATAYYDEETGSWQQCSDEWQCYVACVALNRVESERFSNSLEEVIFQVNEDGEYDQYATAPIIWETEPSERAYVNAERVLNGYRPVPREVLFQAEFIQGPVWVHIGNTYFCYPSF